MEERSLGGRIYLILIGLMVAGMGVIFVAWLWHGYQKAKETRAWRSQEAVILESVVEERLLGPEIPKEFALKLTYEYSVEGKSYFGDRLRRRENPWSKERARAQVLAEQFRVGQRVTVYVNPQMPQEAVLEHETKAPGYSIWFPALFIIGGLGIVIKSIKKN